MLRSPRFPSKADDMADPILRHLCRFPIKGLSGQSLLSGQLEAHQGMVGDRRYAMTIKPEVDGGEWKSSRNFLINSVNDNLLKIEADFSIENWSLQAPNLSELSVNPRHAAEVVTLNQKLPDLLSLVTNAGAKPRFVERAKDKGPAAHWDYPDSQLSFINLASLKAFSEAIDTPLDFRRFRANCIFDGLPAWAEFGLSGWRYGLGDAEIEFGRPARRCPAIGVNPVSGERDVDAHILLNQKFGHGYFGIYARVVKSGKVSCSDTLVRLGPAFTQPIDAMVEGAGNYALWPKGALIEMIEKTNNITLFGLKSRGGWPLIVGEGGRRMKLHLETEKTIDMEIHSTRGEQITVSQSNQAPMQDFHCVGVQPVVVTGPFGR